MPKVYDATCKDLVASYPGDFGAAFGLAGPVPLTVHNVELSIVSAATDVVLGRGQPPDAFIILDFQSHWENDLLSRTLLYNAILHHQKQVPVHSMLVLLRPIAHLDRLEGGVHYAVWPERGQTDHRFEIIKLWEQPVARFLAGGLGILPLVPLCQMTQGSTLEEALPGILHRINERLMAEAKPEDAGRLWTATFFLTGLRIPEDRVLPLFQGVYGMQDSSTYQYVLRQGKALGEAEGAAKELRKILLLQGQLRFGPPSAAAVQALESLSDLERMERMAGRVIRVSSWQELLDTP
jgi:hypothetical protein